MMPTNSAADERRSPIRGLLQIVRFNWPQYIKGIVSITAAMVALAYWHLPGLLFRIAAIGIAAASWWLVASLVASFWIYDASPLTSWTWLKRFLPTEVVPGRLLNIHSGFDDTTRTLRALFPGTNVTSVDLFDPKRMTEPSVRRARIALRPPPDSVAATPEKLSFGDRVADGVLLLLAAHELRRPSERESLFREVRRVLKHGGRVVLVEHARDASNFVAFGPGFTHFLPFAEWLRLASLGNFRTVAAGRITPFVRYLILEK